MLSALRELRADMLSRPVLAGVIGAGVILGISGPFDTLRQLSLIPRVLYWVFVAGATFGLGNFVIILITKLTPKLSPQLKLAYGVPAIALAVTLLLLCTNAVVFGVWPDTAFDAAEMFLIVMAITAVIQISSAFLQSSNEAATPVILARLPFEKRGALIALSATDHYVEVKTTNGSELILIRLADAIKEAGTNGLQVHRSHWVALDQIDAVRRDNGRVLLTMSNNTEIPVSRSYLPAVKAAGLLPRSRMDIA